MIGDNLRVFVVRVRLQTLKGGSKVGRETNMNAMQLSIKPTEMDLLMINLRKMMKTVGQVSEFAR